VEDSELLNVQTEGVDIYITNKEVDGHTLQEMARWPGARGIFLKKDQARTDGNGHPRTAENQALPR
jgi:hypothetical protein